MKTNSKHVKNLIEKHILDSVYDFEENQFSTFEEAKNHLLEEFKRVAEHEYNIKKFPNRKERFSDYLQGIPFHFEYENHAIKEFLNSLGTNPNGKEYTDEQSLKLYHYLIFKATI